MLEHARSIGKLTILLESLHSCNCLWVEFPCAWMLGPTFAWGVVMGQMFTIYASSQNPCSLVFESIDTEVTSAFTRFGLALTLLSRDLLLVRSTTVADQEDLLQSSVVAF